MKWFHTWEMSRWDLIKKYSVWVNIAIFFTAAAEVALPFFESRMSPFVYPIITGLLAVLAIYVRNLPQPWTRKHGDRYEEPEQGSGSAPCSGQHVGGNPPDDGAGK